MKMARIYVRDYVYDDGRDDELTKELSDPGYALKKEQERQEKRKREEWKKGFSRYNKFQADYDRAHELLNSDSKMIEEAKRYYAGGYSVTKEIVKTCASLAALISLLVGTYKFTGKGDLDLETTNKLDKSNDIIAEECYVSEENDNDLTFAEYAKLDLDVLSTNFNAKGNNHDEASIADLYDKALLLRERDDIDKELSQKIPVGNRIIATGLACSLYFMLYIIYIAFRSLISDEEPLTLIDRIERIISTLNNTKDTKMTRKEYDRLIKRMNKEIKRVFKETKGMMESKPEILSKIESIKSDVGHFYFDIPLTNSKYFIEEAYDCLYSLENDQIKRTLA